MMSRLYKWRQSRLRPSWRSGGGGGLRGIALHPVLHREVEELLGPQEPGACLPRDAPGVFFVALTHPHIEELVSLPAACLEDLVRVGRRRAFGRQSQNEAPAGAGVQVQTVQRGRFGAFASRVHALREALHQVGMEGVLHIETSAFVAEQPLCVGLVFGEQQFVGPRRLQPVLAQRDVIGEHCGFGIAADGGLRPIALASPAPRPRIAEPQRGEQHQRRRLRAAINRRYTNDQIIRAGFGVLHEDIEISPAFERAGVFQFEFLVGVPAPPVFFDQPGIGKSGLGILVQRLHVGVRGR